MIRKGIWIMALVSLSWLSWQCSNNQLDREKARIAKLEKQFYEASPAPDPESLITGESLLSAYIDYAALIKDSVLAPEYLFKAAELALGLNKAQQSLELFNRIIYQFPAYERVPECLFLMGFIYENNLQNFGKAKDIYERFIQRYPDHEFADDAAISIQNLGKTPEELVREFEQKNRVDL